MIRRPLRPHFGEQDKLRLLEALKDARRLALNCGAAVQSDSHRYKICDRVRKSIDDLAEELTSDRAHFHPNPNR